MKFCYITLYTKNIKTYTMLFLLFRSGRVLRQQTFLKSTKSITNDLPSIAENHYEGLMA